MRFYNVTHKYYCGIDLHARNMYTCVLDQEGKVRKLAGREGWRIRVGNYRVIYEIDDSARQVTILHVGHRKDVYR